MLPGGEGVRGQLRWVASRVPDFQCFLESVRFSDRFSWNSGGMPGWRVEIQQEFEECCEGIQGLQPHAKRARGTVVDYNAPCLELEMQ